MYLCIHDFSIHKMVNSVLNLLKFKIPFCILLIFISLHNLSAQINPEIELANQYYNEGDFEKALQIYVKVQKSQPEDYFLAQQIVDSYCYLEKYTEANEFITKHTKKNAKSQIFNILKGYVLKAAKKDEDAMKVWDEVIAKQIKDFEDFTRIGNYFYQKTYYKYAAITFVQARTTLKRPELYRPELAEIYFFIGEIGNGITELLNIYLANPTSLEEVKSKLSIYIDDQHKDEIEKSLLKVQNEHSKNLGIRELLFDFYVQTENFDEAFLQVKSIDKTFNEKGVRVYNFAKTLQNNRQYDLSNDALDYIGAMESSPFYMQSFLEKNVNYELKAFEKRPIDTVALRQAVNNYDNLFAKFGRFNHFQEAMLRKANLCVFYLNDLPQAIAEIDQIEKLTISDLDKAKARLLRGDIYLIQGDYVLSFEKYKQVDDKAKGEQVGALAKFSYARLDYFKGDFESSKGFLKVLKDNTTNDISNDAIKLYLLIMENTGLDSTTTALQQFAKAQLFTFQKRYDESLKLMDSIQYNFPNHVLKDDILWEKAKILLAKGDIDKAIILIDIILEKHSTDIWADDALFTKAELYHYTLNNKDKAMELYLKILSDYPASLYKVEARKRIRALRGDKS